LIIFQRKLRRNGDIFHACPLPPGAAEKDSIPFLATRPLLPPTPTTPAPAPAPAPRAGARPDPGVSACQAYKPACFRLRPRRPSAKDVCWPDADDDGCFAFRHIIIDDDDDEIFGDNEDRGDDDDDDDDEKAEKAVVSATTSYVASSSTFHSSGMTQSAL
jgi:hypothetical protein